MRVARFFPALILAALTLLCVTPNAVMAQEIESGVDNQFTIFLPMVSDSINLEEFVHLTLDDAISVEQFESTFDRLSEAEQQEFYSIAETVLGPPPEPVVDVDVDVAEVSAAYGFRWTQHIEYRTILAYPNRIPAHYYYTSRLLCDHNRDVDYTFFYRNGLFNANPDGVKWNTHSPQVAAALRYGTVKGFSYDYNHVQLCLGNNTVWFAGGAESVRRELFITNE